MIWSRKSKKQKAYESQWGKDDDSAPGWDAIDDELAKIYGVAEPAQHWGSPIEQRAIFGGAEIIDGVSVYNATNQAPHSHIITYGLSELYYAPESVDQDYSKYGLELTMRVYPIQEDQGNSPVWAVNMLKNIANYIHRSGNVVAHGHYMPAGGSIRQEYETALKAVLFVQDTELSNLEEPHGRVEFVQAVGITLDEYEAIKSGSVTAENLASQLRAHNSLLITDLDRLSIL